MNMVTHNIPQLVSTLRKYQSVSGKSWGDIIANESQWTAVELYREFKKISPAPGQIYNDAASRDYAMGRRSNFIAQSVRGISAAAWAGAANLLGDQKSDYFKILIVDGRPQIRRLRFSKFVRGGMRTVLKGGRRGNRFAPGSLTGRQVEREQLRAAISANPGIRPLNQRALATALEIGLRSRAAKGGLMAVQWLPSVYKSRKSAMVKTGPIVVRSTHNIPLGQIDFVMSGAEPVGVTLSGFVPGTARQGEQRGVVTRAINSRIADRLKYINERSREAAQRGGFKVAA